VAQSFLRPRRKKACQIVVASAGGAALLQPATEALFEASQVLGFNPGVLGARPRDPGATDGTRDAGFWIVEAAGVHEGWLSRLEPPPGPAPELLLWLLGNANAWLRESYLFGMLSWSLGPAKSVLLVDGLSAEVLEQLRVLNADEAEVLALPFGWQHAAAASSLMQQLLQSALSRAGHFRQPPLRLGRAGRA
jgi:hypothetical protein